MRTPPTRLNDPRARHERLYAEIAGGARSIRSLSDDIDIAFEQGRGSPADRPRVTGNLWDGSGFLSALDAQEYLGVLTNEISIEERWHEPYERNESLIFRGAAPSVTPGAVGIIGTGGTVNLADATDNTGRIVLATGTGVLAAGLICTITFNVARINTGFSVGFDARDSDAASPAGLSIYSNFATATATSFPVACQTALAASTSYHWDYTIKDRVSL